MFTKNNCTGLDFETYSNVDLLTRGLEAYVSGKHFRPLIARTASYLSNISSNTQDGVFDFVVNGGEDIRRLRYALEDRYIVAHNAYFEWRVLKAMGIDIPLAMFIDSAVVARAYGAAGKLEACAPQLLNVDKMEDGRWLIKKFCIPSAEQKESGDLAFQEQLVRDNPDDWELFHQYCQTDADLSLRLGVEFGILNDWLSSDEHQNQTATLEMNFEGWPVDVESVEEMQRRYLENQAQALEDFREAHDSPELNLNSLPQLKAWCAERGIKASSFDEKNVAKMHERISGRLNDADDGSRPLETEKYHDYCAVVDLLEVKMELGGSSLKKLPVILDTVSEDGRLRDQYLHIGAGQTWRTTGRSVQMQNLKRLATPMDMETLKDPESEWTNKDLALNLRQVFTSSDPRGQLVVGDFSSVESRGLAWLAGAQWKLDAYSAGQDMYKVNAMKMFNCTYDEVTKAQRQTGKVGELSCGYNAGGPAVQAFADSMGVKFTEAEAATLVYDWRYANPEVVNLWHRLDRALQNVVSGGKQWDAASVGPNQTYSVMVREMETPSSLTKIHASAQSLEVQLYDELGSVVLRRAFHGCYLRGRQICYYKPSERKTGALWSSHFRDPKTKEIKYYNIYGGKLSGILTQSMCREIFFDSLIDLRVELKDVPNTGIIGQFHDEIVVDWVPAGKNGLGLDELEEMMDKSMSTSTFAGLPMAAEIKHAYRYIK